MQERLQKLISRAGVASRRHAEQLIVTGQVTVNGQVVTKLGSKADAETDHIKVGGKLLRFSQARMYLALNKPAGCVATMSDPEGRQSLRDCLHGVPGRVFPAGRLDFHTEGLLLLTNDGELVNRLLKVSGHLPQVYWIKVKGQLDANALRQVQQVAGARMAPLKSREGAPNPWYEATVTEAKSDALRQNLSKLGHHVEKIRRVKLAELELGAIEPGQYRMLSEGEVAGLLRAVGRATGKPAAAAPVPIPYRGSVSASPQRRPPRPRSGGAVRYGSDRPAATQNFRGRQAGRPSGTPTRPTTGRGPRPGGARPARPPEFPRKRWSRPGAPPTGPTTGRGPRPGGARPARPPEFPRKRWSRPGAPSTGQTSGRGAGQGSSRPAGPPRQFSGKPPGKQWGKPSGNKPKWKTGGKGEHGPRGRSGKPAPHKRTDRG